MLHVVIARVVVVDTIHGSFALVGANGVGVSAELGGELRGIFDFLVRGRDGGEDEVGGFVIANEGVLLGAVADLEGCGGLFVAAGGVQDC